MRLTKEQSFNAGAVHGYLNAKQGTWFRQMGDSEFTRRLVEGKVWEDFRRNNPEEASNYNLILSQWNNPKRKTGRS